METVAARAKGFVIAKSAMRAGAAGAKMIVATPLARYNQYIYSHRGRATVDLRGKGVYAYDNHLNHLGSRGPVARI